MNCRLRRQGVDLGEFTLEQLRQRREAGLLTGGEYVQLEGAADWRPLDWVLRNGDRAPSSLGQAPQPAIHGGVWAAAIVAVLVGVVLFSYVAKGLRNSSNLQFKLPHRSHAGAKAAAMRPVLTRTNASTEVDVSSRRREFRSRQWLDAYRERGRRDPDHGLDLAAIELLESWVAAKDRDYWDTPPRQWADSDDELVGHVADPLILAVAGEASSDPRGGAHRIEKALKEFEKSNYRAYPKFFAAVSLAALQYNKPEVRARADGLALAWLDDSLADGSVQPGDQQELAEFLVHGRGEQFFARNRHAIVLMPAHHKSAFRWLALVLEGESKLKDALGLEENPSDATRESLLDDRKLDMADARRCFKVAWELEPGYPLAPARMIYLCSWDSTIGEARLWFDRAVAGQIDYPEAWREFRMRLRPSEFGDLELMLEFGMAAAKSDRFDSGVPRQLFRSVSEVEALSDLAPGRHLYGRSNLWPHLQRVYEGYIAHSSSYGEIWRTQYAATAFLAGKYATAREQLEAMNWRPRPRSLVGWGADLTLMAQEVAARTSSIDAAVIRAESARDAGRLDDASAIYASAQNGVAVDDLTKQFIRRRQAELDFEKRFGTGEWVAFLPEENDPKWVTARGKLSRASRDEIEIESGPEGHFLYMTARTGRDFEIQGEFDLAKSSGSDFQAGIVFGLPVADDRNWYGITMRRGNNQEDSVEFNRGWLSGRGAQKAPLRKEGNVFDFQYRSGLLSAVVNDANAIQQSAPPKEIRARLDQFGVGFGAPNEMKSTTIRYRNVRIRKLF